MTVHHASHPFQVPAITTDRVSSWVKGHALTTYFLLAFAGTWLCLLPILLGNDGFGLINFTPPTTLLAILMTFLGPALAGVVTTWLIEGKAGLERLWRRYGTWRVGLQWYSIVLVGPILLLLLGASLFFGATPLTTMIQRWPLFFTVFLVNFPITLLLNGPLGEELGWRGFALPHMQARYGALPGTLGLGLLHGLWHLPLFFIIGAYAPFTYPGLAMFVLGVLFNAIVWTWVFNHTAGSLLMITLLHAAVNAGGGYVQQLIPASPSMELIPIIAYGGCALLIILFTKGRLGYKPVA